jgi:recombination protein RecA
MYNEGISTEGELLALGERFGIIQKSGSSYAFGEEKLGRGYDASRTTLRENKKVSNDLLREIRKAFAEGAQSGKAPVNKGGDEE